MEKFDICTVLTVEPFEILFAVLSSGRSIDLSITFSRVSDDDIWYGGTK